MFISFFYLLRARGLEVSMNEWMTLMEALGKGLAQSNLTKFYYLCRAVLVKSESDFDKYDSAFLEYFENIRHFEGDELPPELLNWLNNPDHEKPEYYNQDLVEELEWLGEDEIMRMFRERLEEQKEEHDGGTYWIGTHGASAFGNDGFGNKGIRVGGESKKRRAMMVAGERKFRDFRRDKILDNRDFQVAFRSLRQYSTRIDAPKTELDIDSTVRETGDNAGHLKLVYQKPRKNTVKLLLLMDSGGSMDYYSELCMPLFHAVSKSNHFSDLKIYYFHNCIKSELYTTPAIDYRETVSTQWVLNNYDGEYKLIIVGDALMDTYELMSEYSYRGQRVQPSIELMKTFRERYPHNAWVTPEVYDGAGKNYWGWGYSQRVIREVFDMYPLTVDGLSTAIKQLLVNR